MSGINLRQRKRRNQPENDNFSPRETDVMDEENALRFFVSSVKQFFNKKNETNLRLVVKHVDNLLNVKFTPKTFDPRSLLISDCIINLTELLTDLGIECEISDKIIQFFHNFARQSPLLMKIIQSTFNIACTIATILSTSLNNPLDVTFINGLSLLAVLTEYQQQNDDISVDLIQFLIKNVQSFDKNLLLPSVKLLANLCRHSQIAHQLIQSMDKLKEFYKYLMNLVGDPDDPELALGALSLITAVAVNEPVFGDFFNPRNIQQVLQFLFNHLSDTKKFSSTVDLFLNFLDYPGVENRLLKFKHFDFCLSHVLDTVIPALKNGAVSKSSILLTRFCNVQHLKSRVVNLILKSELETRLGRPISLAVDGISINDDDVESTLISLEFLTAIFKAVVSPAPPVDLSQQVEILLSNVIILLKEPFESENLFAKWHCQRISSTFSLLNILISEPLYRDKILEIIEIETCRNILQIQFERNKLESSDSVSSIVNWNDEGVRVILDIINFLSNVTEFSPEAKNILTWALQDSRLVPFMAAALSSDCVSRTALGLNIIQNGFCLNNFPFKSLAETLALKNTKSTENQTNNYHPQSPNGKVLIQESNVDELIQKMENGLKVKDMKSSEIMEMYEHKIESFRIKEKHLHNLLEAKSNALQQADRILTQYRCRWAQSDAEALNLRVLLQDSEKRSEAAKDQTTSTMVKEQQTRDAYEQVKKEIHKMEKIAEEKNEAFNELVEKLESSEKTCGRLRDEITQSLELNNMLQRHIETYKEKEATLASNLTNLEKDKKVLCKKLKDHEDSISELSKTCHDLENQLKEKSLLLSEQQNLAAELRENLHELEREKKTKEEEVLNLEEICGQLEKNLKEKESKNKSLNDELEKQKQITSLIQNITSGRMDLSMLDNNK